MAAFFNMGALKEMGKDDLLMDGKIDEQSAHLALKTVSDAVAKVDIKHLPESINERVECLTQHFKSVQPSTLDGRSYLHPTRVAITGMRQSMNMFEYLAAYFVKNGGKDEILNRLNRASQLLSTSK
jgi:hypothetical protein